MAENAHGARSDFTTLTHLLSARLVVRNRELFGEILMPAEWVQEEAATQVRAGVAPADDAFIVELARRFDVSPKAMSYRLANLGIGLQI